MKHGWYEIENVRQIPSPTVLVYPDRIEANLRRMIRSVGDPSRLRPHVKTHKTPQIVQLKLSLGITKFKASTIAEVEMVLAAGGRDVLLAYQPVGPNIDRMVRLIQAYPTAKIAALIDDRATLHEIASAAAVAGITAALYLDLNVGMNRTGVPTDANAVQFYQMIADTPHISAAGLHAYDGHILDRDLDSLAAKTEQAFESVWWLKRQLQQSGYPVPNIVASGTPTSAIMAQHDGVEVGAGTTVLWDAGQGEHVPEFGYEAAAVLLCRVISHPGPDRICIDLGHKSVASEFPPPRVKFFGLEDAVAVTHSEEHLVLETDRGEDFPTGTALYGLPYHICPTVALHQSVWCVRERIATETWDVTARNRCLTI